MQDIWTQVKQALKEKVNSGIYQTWFAPTTLTAASDDGIVVQVPNRVYRDWIQDNFSKLLAEVVTGVSGSSMKVSLVLPPEDCVGATAVDQAVATEVAVQEEENPAYRCSLIPRYTFESFVVGSCNQLAHAAALAVAETPSSHYNPLFIYGGVGLGKTHLMHAVGNRILAQRPYCRLMYISLENFMNELIYAIRFEKMQDFRCKYRGMDVLLIDDVQFLAGKERTREEFFHTFNALYDARKQIIISSDRLPKEIPTLEERLQSRFEWGLIADIQPPDLETKIAILQKKADDEHIDLPGDVALFIAQATKSNVRELEGSLNRVGAFASMLGRQIDLEFAQEVLQDLRDQAQSRVTVDTIQRTVAAHFGVKPTCMKSKLRTKEVAYPRQIAMYLSRRLTGSSLPEIGREFGGKDHTTVIYACTKVKKILATDPSLRRTIEKLSQKLTT